MIGVCIVSIGMPHEGGAELRSFRLAQQLRTAVGIESMLIVRDRPGSQSQDYALPSYVYRVSTCFQESRGTQTSGRFIRLFLHLCELGVRLGWLLFTLRQEFDVLHVIFAASWFSLMSIPLAKALGKPVIVEMVAMHTDDPLTLNRRSGHPHQQLFPHQPLKYSLFLKRLRLRL